MKLPSLIDALQEERGWNLVIVIGLKIFRLLLFVFCGWVILFVIWNLPLRVIATTANSFSNLILAILTLALVAITGFYAIITYKMLIQIREGRRSEVRPLLWVNVGKPEFRETTDELIEFSVSNMVIANYGKGSAVGIRFQYVIPYGWNDEFDRPDPVVASVRSAPTLLSHGQSFESKLSITTPAYDRKKYASRFLEFRILYEDTERNLYKMDQSFDLSIIDMVASETYYSLRLRKEKLVFVAFSDRGYVGDLDESVMDEGKHQVIFSRRSSI